MTQTTRYTDDGYALHPGFPAIIRSAYFNRSSAIVVDLDNNGENEIVIGTVQGEVHALTAAGEKYRPDVFPLIVENGNIMGNLAFGDLDNDGDLEIVAGVGSAERGQKGFVYIWKPNGRLLPGWPQSVERFGSARPSKITSVVLADLTNDGDLEVVANTNNNTFDFGFQKPVPDLYVWEHTGKLAPGDWPAEEEPSILGMVAVGDFNGDGHLDILVGRDHTKTYAYDHQGNHLPNWPVETFVEKNSGTNSTDPRIENKLSAPTLADLDNDGKAEYIITGFRRDPGEKEASNSALLVLHPDSSRHPDWKFPAHATGILGKKSEMQQGSAIADLDGDNNLDIVVPMQDGRIRAYRVNQTLLWEFDYAHGQPLLATEPVIGDVDGDNLYEIVFGTHDPEESGQPLTFGLWILEHNGVPKFKGPFPVEAPGIRSAPSLDDLDGDGRLDIIAASRVGNIYAWHTPAPYRPLYLPWPVARHNLQRTASFAGDHIEATKSSQPASGDQGKTINYTIRLERANTSLTHTIRITNVIPADLTYIENSLEASHGAPNDDLAPLLRWEGDLAATNLITITYRASINTAETTGIKNTAEVNAGPIGTFTRTAVTIANPESHYVPVVQKE